MFMYFITFFTALFSKVDGEKLTKELTTMVSFNHPNVMPLIGACLDKEIPLIIMPFMSNGSVLESVKKQKVELFLSEEAPRMEVYCIAANFRSAKFSRFSRIDLQP